MPKTILLLGGTSETVSLAEALAAADFVVLVSTATAIPLNIGRHPHIRRRSGPLDEAQLVDLIQAEDIRAILDATHPYAELIGRQARAVSQKRNLPYFRWLRPAALSESTDVLAVADHTAAAALAFSFGSPVLLTIGSRNLEPYVRESRRTGIPVVARVLDHPESRAVCQKRGLPEEAVLAEKGPFSVDENQTVLRNYRIRVLVTKDSGAAGGVPEKLEAARLAGCRVIVVRRPEPPEDHFSKVEGLMAALIEALGP
ncbi:MAG: precorrin-6A reductase [Deltaproteobacteria bacterium]|nr:precorrin-6A reductase [Deltaproteobacteria bacterium]